MLLPREKSLSVLAVVLICLMATQLYAQPVVDSAEAQQRFAWRAQHDAMNMVSPFRNVPFQFIGPEVMSGRATDVDAHPSDRETWYVTTASGGVWKTTNEGDTWLPILCDGSSTVF